MNPPGSYFRKFLNLLFLVLCGMLHAAELLAADDSVEIAALQIMVLENAPVIDGEVGVAEWADAAIFDGYFMQVEPDYGEPSPFRTVVRIGQTKSALYVAFEAYDPDISRLAATSTRRDNVHGNDDSVALFLDTFGDDRTAYMFRSNALATQEDARIADNGRTVDLRWDEAWHSAAVRLDDRWTVEIEIPFSILKYDADTAADWGLNFLRKVPRRLENSLWSGPAESVFRVSAFGALSGLDLPEPEDPWQFIPYALVSVEKDDGSSLELGGDIRWRPSSRLGVDLTLNPDFALVEADVEEINLSRFELFVPEKRPFFLEGNEMYSQRIRQFYSRRIGDITAGAKSNGKVWRSDFSAIVTTGDLLQPDGVTEETAHYGVLRVQHGLARGSNIGVLASNRNFLGDDAGTLGVDTTLFFTETLGMTAQLMRVHGPVADGGLAWFVRPAWDTSTSHFHVRYTEIDAGILEDANATGFMRDDDRKEFDTNLSHKFWIEKGPLEKIYPRVNYNRFTSQAGVLRSWELDAKVDFVFRSGWVMALEYLDEFKLFEKEFRNDRTVATIGWDGRDGRFVSVHAGSGFNFDSDLTLYGFNVKWPFGDSLRLSYDFTRLELDPDPEFESTTIHVFEALYSFNTDLFVKLFLQTNSAIEKENLQLLGVWRFKPPFGALQVAYQRGTSEQGQVSKQGDTFFTKLSWVF